MEPHCAAACSLKKADHISTSPPLCDCIFVYVHAGVNIIGLNLHGNNVPVSQTPARIREAGRQEVSCLSRNGKNIRCWCTKKNQT